MDVGGEVGVGLELEVAELEARKIMREIDAEATGPALGNNRWLTQITILATATSSYGGGATLSQPCLVLRHFSILVAFCVHACGGDATIRHAPTSCYR